MQGNLSVESKWGIGSTFTFSFPAKVAKATAALAVDEPATETEIEDVTLSPPATTGQKAKILLVEDNPDMQQMIQQLLATDYEYVQARDGQEAWEMLSGNHPDVQDISLILSDIMMPRMDGYALLDRIKADEAWRRKPVVMLTARASESDKLDALRMGVDDYLTKPFSPEELKARLANLIGNYQARKQFLADEQGVAEDSGPQLSQVDQAWLKQAEEIIMEAIEQGIKLSAAYLAGEIGLSERQLFRRIKALTGLSVNKYIQEIKLQKARRLLKDKVFNTIAEVAYASGFNTPGYFSKIFEAHFGKSPGEY